MPLESINLHGGSGSDFQPTEEEVKSIKDKMKDPEFMKLMTEYMTSLQNPEYRKEEEEYLNQIEKEAKNQGDYSFDFIFPSPSFYVELLDVGEESGSKNKKKEPNPSRVFINLCTSDKIAEYQEETTGNRDASHWHVPVSVGRAREEYVLEQDNPSKDEKCTVYDAVFHPATMALSERSNKFMTFLVEIAVENINGGYSKQYGYTYRRCSGSTATIKAVGTPTNQTIRKEPGKKGMFEVNRTDPISKAPMNFGTNNIGKTNAVSSEATAAKPPPSDGSYLEEDHQNLPKHSISHRGEIDLTDAWNWKGVSDKRIGVPKELVVKMDFSVAANPKMARRHPSFTGVKSAASLEVDISPDGMTIELRKSSVGHPFHGVVVLPFKVEETPSSAKFDKNKSLLTLVLSVIAPLLTSTQQGKEGDPSLEANTIVDSVKTTYDERESVGTQRSVDEMLRVELNEPLKTENCTDAADQHIPDRSPIITTLQGSQLQSNSNVDQLSSFMEEKPQSKYSDYDLSKPNTRTGDFCQEAEVSEEQKTATSSSIHPEVLSAPSRMEEVMKRVAMARKEREDAESAERGDKEKEEKAALGHHTETGFATDTSGKMDNEKNNEKYTNKEEIPEVIDLRQRQAEWLKAEKERKEAVERQATSSLQGAMEALAKAFEDDDETEEEKAYKLEEERKAKKALSDQKREEAAKIEKERLATLMMEKIAELPLKSKLIFEIE